VTAASVGPIGSFQFSVGISSDTDGYRAGGIAISPTPAITTTVERFPFSAPFTSMTSVGDLFVGVISMNGTSDNIDGVIASGYFDGTATPQFTDVIQSFPFASPFTTASNIGSIITSARRMGSHRN
jgi:hypothetical protein